MRIFQGGGDPWWPRRLANFDGEFVNNRSGSRHALGVLGMRGETPDEFRDAGNRNTQQQNGKQSPRPGYFPAGSSWLCGLFFGNSHV